MAYVLATARLGLRQMTLRDLDFVAAMLADPEVMRFYPEPYEREDAAEWLRRQRDRYADDGHGLWLVEDRATGVPIGQVGLCMQEMDDGKLPEIGYLVHRPFWGRGYATEAARATRDHAFGVLGYRRVISLVRPENRASRTVAERLGMRISGAIEHDGRGHLVFAVDRSRPSICDGGSGDCARAPLGGHYR